jgi:hypothetical protein
MAELLHKQLSQPDLAFPLKSGVERAAFGIEPVEFFLQDLGIVTQDVGVMALPVIDIRVAVDVIDVRAMGLRHDERIRPPKTERMAPSFDHDLLSLTIKGEALSGLLSVFRFQEMEKLFGSVHVFPIQRAITLSVSFSLVKQESRDL